MRSRYKCSCLRIDSEQAEYGQPNPATGHVMKMKLRQVAFIFAVLALAFWTGCETRSANAETLQVATPPADANQPDTASPAGQVDVSAAAAPGVGEKTAAAATKTDVGIPDPFADPFAGATDAPVLPQDLVLAPALADVVKL